jgi:hypothetical protein
MFVAFVMGLLLLVARYDAATPRSVSLEKRAAPSCHELHGGGLEGGYSAFGASGAKELMLRGR